MARAVEYLDNDGETVIASRSYDWGSAAANETDVRKRWIRNSGDVALSSGFVLQLQDILLNGGVGIFQWALDTVTTRPPYGGAAVIGVGGGVFGATGTRYFRVTRTAAGSTETQGCIEFSYTVVDISKKINLTWSLPAGGGAGTGVRVYATTSSGVYTTPALIASLGAASTSYTWDGTTPAAGALPAANTTGGAAPDYGTAPSLATSDLAVGAVGVGESRPYWIGFTIGSAPGDDTFSVNNHPTET